MAEPGDEELVVNLTGALVVALGDELRAAATGAAEHGAAAPAALVALAWAPGCSIDTLAHTVGLTHSGAVRLVDRLQAAGLVERRAGPRSDRGAARSVALHLTDAGEVAARKVLHARREVLHHALRPLSPAQREELGALLSTVLASLTRSREHADAICRLCDEESCPDDRCPVETAVGHTHPHA